MIKNQLEYKLFFLKDSIISFDEIKLLFIEIELLPPDRINT